jgi:hypothetical protein
MLSGENFNILLTTNRIEKRGIVWTMPLFD